MELPEAVSATRRRPPIVAAEAPDFEEDPSSVLFTLRIADLRTIADCWLADQRKVPND